MMTRKLIDIIDESLVLQYVGDYHAVTIDTIALDSRKVESRSLFIAVKGVTVDGHDYIDAAIENGASAIMCEHLPDRAYDGVVILVVRDTKEAVGRVASAFYGAPSKEMTVVGVTGTNGKTTTATLLYQLFGILGKKCGLISTVDYRIGEKRYDSTHTTPDALRLQQLFCEMEQAGCEYVFMEVSSHAIDQKRIVGVDFDVAVFTNISRDHLDYHKTFKDYIWTKKKFFDFLHDKATAIINIDDKHGDVMVQNTDASILRYALRRPADVKGRIISNEITGLTLEIDRTPAVYRLVGEFNAYNLLSVYAVAIALDFEKEEVLTAMSGLRGAEGRFEMITVENCDSVGIVDYAHTPDALDNLLKTVVKTRSEDQKIITVVGCGGDRDKGKRPEMAKIASRLSDKVILTSDNPRSEDPASIIEDMMQGVSEIGGKNVVKVSDRREAIGIAVMMADRDIIVVAGKGHEKYQDINGVKTPFDDKKVLAEALQKRT